MLPSYQNILQTIGQTPVIPLRRLVGPDQAQVFGKYEAGNPTYSLKDRVVVAILDDLEKKGQINKNSIIVAASNGNTGVSLAMICAARGYEFHLFMSNYVTAEKQLIPSGYEANIHIVDCGSRFDQVLESAQDFAKQINNAVFIDQFDCPTVVEAHAQTTAQEILNDFPDGVDAFVMCVGTGGTITGVGRVLKEKFPDTVIYAVEPETSAVISGKKPGVTKIHQIGLGFIPKNLDKSLIDKIVTVSDDDAYQTAQDLSKKEGLLLGISSGANVCAALKVATELGPGKKVLTVFCDQGQRYFSLEKYFKR